MFPRIFIILFFGFSIMVSCNIFDSPSAGSIERPFLEVYLSKNHPNNIDPDGSYKNSFIEDGGNSQGRQFRIFPDEHSGTFTVTKTLTNTLGHPTSGLNYIVFVAVGDRIQFDKIEYIRTNGNSGGTVLGGGFELGGTQRKDDGFQSTANLSISDGQFGTLGNTYDGFNSWDYQSIQLNSSAAISNIVFVMKGTK